MARQRFPDFFDIEKTGDGELLLTTASWLTDIISDYVENLLPIEWYEICKTAYLNNIEVCWTLKENK